MYKTLFDLMTDPFPDIAAMAGEVMDYIIGLLLVSPLGPAVRVALANAPPSASQARTRPPPRAGTVQRDSLIVAGPAKPNGAAAAVPPSRTASLMKTFANYTTGALSEPTPVPPSSLRLNGKIAVPSSPNGSLSPGLHSSASTDSLRHLQSRAGKPKSRTPVMDAAAIEAAIATIIKSDDERLRKRRETPALSALDTVGQVLPLKGSFFDFALEYYKESQMRPTETDEPGSVAHNQRVWRRARNESVIIQTQPMKSPAGAPLSPLDPDLQSQTSLPQLDRSGTSRSAFTATTLSQTASSSTSSRTTSSPLTTRASSRSLLTLPSLGGGSDLAFQCLRLEEEPANQPLRKRLASVGTHL